MAGDYSRLWSGIVLKRRGLNRHLAGRRDRSLRVAWKTGLAVLLLTTGTVFLSWSAYIPAKALVAQVLLEQAWQRALAGTPQAKPWAWADTWPIAKISVPRLGQSAIVLAGASGQAMAFGPGHMTATAAIGAPGTAVVAAHRDTHFRFIKHLQTGDAIHTTDRDGITREFVVRSTAIVRAEQSGLNPQRAGATGASLALVTCYPFDAITRGPLRYVVFADLVVYDNQDETAGGTRPWSSTNSST